MRCEIELVTPSNFYCLLFLRVSFPYTRLVRSSSSMPNNIMEHLSRLRLMKLFQNHFDKNSTIMALRIHDI